MNLSQEIASNSLNHDVTHDLKCASCGYMLRGTSIDSRCPECGFAAAESLAYAERRGSVSKPMVIGLIAVIAFVLVFTGWTVFPRPSGHRHRPKGPTAVATAANIEQQVSLYCADNGWSQPPADMDLNVLIPSYLRAKDLIDPWGRPYTLVVPGKGSDQFAIISFGADGLPGGKNADADVFSNAVN